MTASNLDPAQIEVLVDSDSLDDFLGEPPEIPTAVMPIWEAFWHLRLSRTIDQPISIPDIEAYTRGIGSPYLFLTWLPFLQAMDSEFRNSWKETTKGKVR